MRSRFSAFATKHAPGPIAMYPRGGEFPERTSPAAEAGVLAGDVLLELDGKPVSSPEDVVAAGASFDGSPVRMKVRTGDAAARELTVTPRSMADAKEREAFLSGLYPKEKVEVGGVGGAAAAALDRTWTEIGNIFRLIGRFFGGGVSFQKNISGPLTIANLASQSASGGLGSFLSFLAFISVNLCVLNFLPIPVLDGGQMLFLIIEKVRGGRRLSDNTIARFQLAGFLLLMLLMVFAFKNDITNVFGK
jgi:regulator of sigma E protease